MHFSFPTSIFGLKVVLDEGTDLSDFTGVNKLLIHSEHQTTESVWQEDTDADSAVNWNRAGISFLSVTEPEIISK